MKIFITGTVGSGKTTLAKKLSEELNIKYYELDSIVHNNENNQKVRTQEEQKEIIQDIDSKGSWILEGVLRKNHIYLLDLCDRIIFLNTPKKIRNRRIFV